MESIKIYEQSLKELSRILKETSTDHITIDFTKVDTTTKSEIITTLRTSCNKRAREVEKVCLGRVQ